METESSETAESAATAIVVGNAAAVPEKSLDGYESCYESGYDTCAEAETPRKPPTSSGTGRRPSGTLLPPPPPAPAAYMPGPSHLTMPRKPVKAPPASTHPIAHQITPPAGSSIGATAARRRLSNT